MPDTELELMPAAAGNTPNLEVEREFKDWWFKQYGKGALLQYGHGERNGFYAGYAAGRRVRDANRPKTT